MILQIVTYLKEFSTVTVVTEDLMLRIFSSTTFILMFLSILVTGIRTLFKSVFIFGFLRLRTI